MPGTGGSWDAAAQPDQAPSSCCGTPPPRRHPRLPPPPAGSMSQSRGNSSGSVPGRGGVWRQQICLYNSSQAGWRSRFSLEGRGGLRSPPQLSVSGLCTPHPLGQAVLREPLPACPPEPCVSARRPQAGSKGLSRAGWGASSPPLRRSSPGGEEAHLSLPSAASSTLGLCPGAGRSP